MRTASSWINPSNCPPYAEGGSIVIRETGLAYPAPQGQSQEISVLLSSKCHQSEIKEKVDQQARPIVP